MDSFQFVLWNLEDALRQYQFAIVVYLLFSHTVLAIHECGHALTGALLGLRSTGIRIGTGQVFRFAIRGYAVIIGWRPGSGHTTFVDEGNFPKTWQVLVTYLAGPLSVVLAGPVFFLCFRHSHLLAASIFGALAIFAGLYDLRKATPDGTAIRQIWKVLRSEGLQVPGHAE